MASRLTAVWDEHIGEFWYTDKFFTLVVGTWCFETAAKLGRKAVISQDLSIKRVLFSGLQHALLYLVLPSLLLGTDGSTATCL